MRNILDIYKEYKLPENLQLHQLRVASVAKVLAESYKKESLPIDVIVKACLLHDMANIVKFDLEHFPDFIKNDEISYWSDVKNEFIKKYGSNENEATLSIVSELGLRTPLVEDIIRHIDFSDSKVEENISVAISHYADMRVGPYGVLSLKERLFKDWATRTPDKKDIAEILYERFTIFEDSFFKDIDLKPEEITDELIAPIIEELKKIEL